LHFLKKQLNITSIKVVLGEKSMMPKSKSNLKPPTAEQQLNLSLEEF
jgi:hypothetical protein